MSQYLDGPKVAAWISARVGSLEDDLNSTDARTVRRWRAGTQANVFAVDKILTRIGYHLTELPESFYIRPEYRYRAKPYTEEAKQKVLDLYCRGVGSSIIAREYGVHPDTLHRWREAAGIPLRGRTVWSAERVLGAIRLWAERYGTPPTSLDWHGNPKPEYPSPFVVRKWFGTFNAAIVEAGFSPAGPGGHRK